MSLMSGGLWWWRSVALKRWRRVEPVYRCLVLTVNKVGPTRLGIGALECRGGGDEWCGGGDEWCGGGDGGDEWCVGYYTCNIRVEYEWKPHRCACCNVFGHVLEECPKNIGTNWGSSYLAGQEANYSGSSFWNAESSSPSTTPIIGKINKMENFIIDEKVILVDNEGKPLRKVDDDSEDEVASVDNEITSFLAKKDGYGTQSLLQQWKDSHELDDYEYDLYDDDMYEGQEIPEMLQAFCDNLDIKVRGRKKK
ncbi:hypothetical protein Tco_0122133 [Tanacetum coccineum]